MLLYNKKHFVVVKNELHGQNKLSVECLTFRIFSANSGWRGTNLLLKHLNNMYNIFEKFIA